MDFTAPSGSTDPNAGYVGKTASTQGSKVPPKAVEYPQRELVAAIRAAGLVSTNDDITQLPQALARGIWIGSLGANPNALVGAIGGGAVAGTFIKTLNPWTELTGIALQTNTSVTVPVTIAGIGSPGGTAAGFLKKRDGSAPAIGDVPTNGPFKIRYDGTNFRFVGGVASDGGGSGSDASSPTYPANRNAVSLIPTGVQAISNNMETAIAFGAPAAGTDPLGLWNASDPTRITIPAGGPARMRISAVLAFTANGTGYRYSRLVQNGGAVWQNGRVVDRLPTGAQICVCQMTGFPSTIALSPGDYFQLIGFQNSGGSLNTDYGTSGAGQTACKLVVEW